MHAEHAPGPIPDIIATSRPLAEAQRLDLALFVVFEEWSVQIAQTLACHTTDPDALRFLARQAEDDGRHLDLFRSRLDQALAVQPNRADVAQALLLRVLQSGARTTAPLRRDEVVAAVVVPPLRRFLERGRAAAETGNFVEALALLNLVFKGMACPLSGFEMRFWRPVDSYLASLIGEADTDERRHIDGAARIVRQLLADDSARARLASQCAGGRAELGEAFRYYARKLVVLTRTEPRPLGSGSPPLPNGRGSDELLDLLLSAAEAGCTQALRQAGIDTHG